MTAMATEHATGERSRAVRSSAFAKARLGNLWLLLPAVLVVLVFFVVPVALIVPQSAYRDGHLSAAAYLSVLTDSYYAYVLWRSMWLSFLSTVVCIVLAYPIAYYATRLAGRKYKRYIYMIVLAPLFTTAVVRVLAWTIILGNQGIVNTVSLALGLIDAPIRMLYTETAIMTGLVYTMVPFAVLTIGSVLENLDGRLEESARDLGATPFQAFLRVTLPLSVPGVSAGAILVFALCLSAYVTPALLGGGRIKVMASLIFEQFMRTSNWPLGSAIACLLLIVTGGVIFAYGRVLERRVTAGLESGRG
jgi:putative spermidine/putrescine transport system permease protein